MTQGSTILIVDDDPEIREIVHILLHRRGFIVRKASDAYEALDMLKEPAQEKYCSTGLLFNPQFTCARHRAFKITEVYIRAYGGTAKPVPLSL